MCEPFATIRARLLQEHFRSVLYLGFECALHGRFRAVVSAESKRERRRHQFFCPECRTRCPVVILGRGLHRGPLPPIEAINANAVLPTVHGDTGKRRKKRNRGPA
jgi:hypothetical protein